MSERIMVLLRGAKDQPEAAIEVLLLIPALVGDVRRIIDDHIERFVSEWNRGIVSHQIGAMAQLDINTDDRPAAAPPKSTVIQARVKNLAWSFAGIEVEETFQQLRILTVPH